jgi:hypothetical protein
LERAAAIDPDAAELEEIRQALQEAAISVKAEMIQKPRPVSEPGSPATKRRLAKRTSKKKRAKRKNSR